MSARKSPRRAFHESARRQLPQWAEFVPECFQLERTNNAANPRHI